MTIENIIDILHSRNNYSMVITLVSVLTMVLTFGSQQSFAIDIGDIWNFGGGTNIELGNDCRAIECDNEQTVDNSKTITDNVNSNIVSESSNTIIDTSGSAVNSSQSNNQPDVPNSPTCLECFEKSHLDSFQLESIFNAYGVTSLEELCAKLQGTSAQDFFSRMGNLHITIDSDCFLQSGVFQQSD